MAYPPYLREKARQMRREKGLTIDELAARLALSRSTIYYWVRDLPIERSGRQNRGQRVGNVAMQAKYRRLREGAYEEGRATFVALAREPLFRDFIALYIAEGSKRDRNLVALCNSDPSVVALADSWFARLSTHPRKYSIQYHADQEIDVLRRFWGDVLGIDAAAIRFQRKSNSNQLNGRTWRSEHGVLTVTVHDTLFRSRLQGWIDFAREQWLISASVGV